MSTWSRTSRHLEHSTSSGTDRPRARTRFAALTVAALAIAAAASVGTAAGTSALAAGADASSGTPAVTAAPVPPFIAPDASWLSTVNYYRAMSGLAPVVEDTSLSSAAALHSCYMLANGIEHDEDPRRALYTAEGDAAGNSSNIATSSAVNESTRHFVELWMTGPFHALGILRPGLTSAGFGRCDNASAPTAHAAATLDVLHGYHPTPRAAQPILFPGDGTTTNLNRFRAETPNPLTFCGWTGAAGLPVMALMPEAILPSATSSISGPNGPVETCTLSEHNTTEHAHELLKGDNVVVAIPRAPLTPGTYTVDIDTGARHTSWSFTVDPNAALDPAPGDDAVAIGAPASLQPITPVRIVDTREQLGAGRLAAEHVQRAQVTGRSPVPDHAQAITANATVTRPAAAGYLTIWNCSEDRPVVATMNFDAGQTVSNAMITSLDASGGFCMFSNVDLDVVIDVNGSFGSSAPARFQPITPRRVLDSRSDAAIGRVSAGRIVTVSIVGADITAGPGRGAALNVTSVDPATDGYVTVFACDAAQPFAASLNPVAGRITSNLVLSPVAADGTVCLYASTSLDLVVDVVGSFAPTSTASEYTPSRPFRFLDTRQSERPALSGGTGGPLVGGSTLMLKVAGTRGIPADAVGVSANIAVTDAATDGYLTAYPCGSRPTTSNVNYIRLGTTSTAAQIPLSAAGYLCLYTQSTAQIIVDIAGWWS